METLTAKHQGIKLAYQRLTATGEPLLLVTGIGAEMRYWHDDFCTALSSNGFQVVRFDNRDAGESSRLDSSGSVRWRRARRRPEVAPYRLEDMADDAAAVLDALDWSSAHIVGHSLGGMIAQMLAIRCPDRVRSLTSISSTPHPHISRARLTTILRLVAANLADAIGRRPRSADEAADRLVRGHRVIGSPDYSLDEVWLRDIAKLRYMRGHDSSAIARQVAAAWASGDLRPALNSVRIPTLVIHGVADPLVRPAGGIATAAAIPDAALAMLDGMGHDLPRELWPEIIDRIATITRR